MKRLVLLVAVAALVVVMTATSASAQPTNPCPPGQFPDPATGTCVAAKDKTRLPPTGGVLTAIMPVAGVLLMGAGVVAYAVVQRR